MKKRRFNRKNAQTKDFWGREIWEVSVGDSFFKGRQDSIVGEEQPENG